MPLPLVETGISEKAGSCIFLPPAVAFVLALGDAGLEFNITVKHYTRQIAAENGIMGFFRLNKIKSSTEVVLCPTKGNVAKSDKKRGPVEWVPNVMSPCALQHASPLFMENSYH
ncbi:hypothetical protein TNCV_4852921 [Trichonephila clavipes]|nr:hypothetical protein TNCV_4852921 [Trichonephila clavipes]